MRNSCYSCPLCGSVPLLPGMTGTALSAWHPTATGHTGTASLGAHQLLGGLLATRAELSRGCSWGWWHSQPTGPTGQGRGCGQGQTGPLSLALGAGAGRACWDSQRDGDVEEAPVGQAHVKRRCQCCVDTGAHRTCSQGGPARASQLLDTSTAPPRAPCSALNTLAFSGALGPSFHSN